MVICYDRRFDYLIEYLFDWQSASSIYNNQRTKAPLRFMLNWPNYLSGYCYLWEQIHV